jgi:hypothetical protein
MRHRSQLEHEIGGLLDLLEHDDAAEPRVPDQQG